MMNQIILRNEFDGKEYRFDPKVANFSQLLSLETTDHQFVLPKSAKISERSLQLIQLFLEAHEYNRPRVITSQILFDSFQNVFNPETKLYTEKYLKPLSKDQIQDLLKTINFLRMDCMQIIIHTFLASKYSLPFEDEKLKSKLKEYRVDSMSSQEIESLKLKYMEYFRHFGQNLSEDFLTEKEEKQATEK